MASARAIVCGSTSARGSLLNDAKVALDGGTALYPAIGFVALASVDLDKTPDSPTDPAVAVTFTSMTLGAVGKQLFHFDTVAVGAPATGRNRTLAGVHKQV